MVRTPFIAGDWKVNLNHFGAIGVVQKLVFALPKEYYGKVDVAVVPPFTDLRSVQTLVEGDKLGVTYGAQDILVRESDAYTDEISASMSGKPGYTRVVVGHSEHHDMYTEDDELVAKKAKAALREDMNPIACVGEPLGIWGAEEHVEYVVSQVKSSLAGLANAELAKTVITYEPVWAIGIGKVASVADAQEVRAAIRETIAETTDGNIARETRILYGGLVKAESVTEIVDKLDVNGGLVDGALLGGEASARFCALAADAAQNV